MANRKNVSLDEFRIELERFESARKLHELQLGQIKDIFNETVAKLNRYIELNTQTLVLMQNAEKNILNRIEGLELREKKFKIPPPP